MTRCFRVLTLLWLVLLSGCSLTGKEKKHHLGHLHNDPSKEVVGTVTVRGEYAKAQTLPITSAGLTLGDAVQQSLRPAVIQMRNSGTSVVERTRVAGPVAETISDIAPVKAAVKEVIRGKEGKNSEQLLTEFLSAIEPIDVPEEQQEQIKSTFEVVVNEESNDDLIRGATNQVVAVVEPLLAAKPAVESASPQKRTVQSPYYRMAVILTRATGEHLVIPLWMVDMTSAADIALSDGESVRVDDYVITGLLTLGEKERGKVLVRGISNGKSEWDYVPSVLQDLEKQVEPVDVSNTAFVNLIVVTRVNDNGQILQFMLPRSKGSPFGEEAAGANILMDAIARPGDVVRFGNLQLAGIVRQGRRDALQRSADQLERDIRPVEEGIASLTAGLESIPFVAQVCQFIEQTAETTESSLRSSNQFFRDAVGF